MQPVRSTKQELETLDYLGDMSEQLARMAARDHHRLLSHLFHIAGVEVEELKRIRRGGMSDKKTDNAA
jgi:hypothetical protein